MGVTELDVVERVEIFVAVRARTCCFEPWELMAVPVEERATEVVEEAEE